MPNSHNWGGDAHIAGAASRVGAVALGDSVRKDAGLLLTLAPGRYTV